MLMAAILGSECGGAASVSAVVPLHPQRGRVAVNIDPSIRSCSRRTPTSIPWQTAVPPCIQCAWHTQTLKGSTSASQATYRQCECEPLFLLIAICNACCISASIMLLYNWPKLDNMVLLWQWPDQFDLLQFGSYVCSFGHQLVCE